MGCYTCGGIGFLKGWEIGPEGPKYGVACPHCHGRREAMRPAITGDAKALAMRKVLVELRDFAMRHGHIALEEAAADAAAAIDLPEPEPTAKAEEEPDYTCPICHRDVDSEDCQHITRTIAAAANRRITDAPNASTTSAGPTTTRESTTTTSTQISEPHKGGKSSPHFP